MIFIALFVFINSQIPEQYRELAEQALKNAKIKTPKELREDTKYPGIYEGPNYRFKLLKPFTSSNTNDIKGFATNDDYCAIVKRKKFNLTNEFIFIEPMTQEMYKLDKLIASDNNVSIYKSSKTNIFYVMTNFELRASTIKQGNSRSPNGMLNPNSFIDIPVKWIKKDNRPEMMKLKDTDIDIGFGMNPKINIDTVFRFNSIWDVKITANIILESHIGGELNIPDDTEIEIPEYQFYEFSIPIPHLNFTMKFMEVDINFCFNFNLEVSLTDMAIEIPVGFNYFKGYKMRASKYFEISKFTKINPDWKVELVNLPEVNTISEVAKKVNSSSFSAKFQVQPYFTLDMTFGNLNATLDLGLQIPFVFEFNFDTEKCLFPYLTGTLRFPFAMFYHFSGINFFDIIDIMEESEDQKILFQMNVGPFCIGGSETFMEGSESFIQDALTTVYHIKSTNFYETRKEDESPLNKQLIFSIHENGLESKILDQRFYPYSYYDKNQTNDVIMVVQGIPEQGYLKWTMNYKDLSSQSSQSNGYAYIKFSDLIFKDDHTATLEVELPKDLDDKEKDITYFTSTIEKCQIVHPGKVFIRKWKYVSFEPLFPYDGKYSMIYFTEEGRMRSNSAQYLSNNMANLDFAQYEEYQETDENFDIFLDYLRSNIDQFSADIEINLNYKLNGEDKKVQLGTFITDVLEKDTTYSSELMNLDEISFNCFIPKSMNATISVSGVIYFITNNEVHLIDEQIIFDSENTTQKEIYLYDETVATFSCSKIIPSITADCSADKSNEKPAQEILAENFELIDTQMSNKISIHFRENEMFKFLRITIPSQFQNTYLGFITPEDNVLSFLYKDETRTAVNENFFYFNVKDKNRIEIPIRRSEIYDKSYDLQLEFFKFGGTELCILDPTQGKDVEFNDEIQRAIIIPTFNNIFYYIVNEPNSESMSDHYVNLDDYNGLYFRNYTKETKMNCTFYLSYAHITDSQPSITVDLSHMKPLLLNGKFEKIKFSIICNNGKEVMATIENNNEKSILKAPIVNGVANLELTEVGIVNFAPVCKDPTGIMCQIEYEKPEKSGYHFIRYPDQSGISTTGAGFWAEVIPVVSNETFMYYKSSDGAIIKYKEYPPEPIEVVMIVEDLYNVDGIDGHYRKICLADAKKTYVTIPFSRSYFNEHMLDFLDYFDTLDLAKLDNDRDGCILIHYTYVNDNNIKVPPQEACDIETTGPIKLDVALLDPNFKDKSAKKKKRLTIAFSVVGGLVGAALIAVAIFCVLKQTGTIETP